MSIRNLPWRAIRRTVLRLRRALFTVPKPDAPALTVETPLARLEAVLRSEHHFESGRPLSYHYYGEDLNLRRPAGTARHDGQPVQLQLHVRAFEQPDGSIELLAHREATPVEHPRLHLKGGRTGLYDDAAGLDRLARVLEQASIDFDRT